MSETTDVCFGLGKTEVGEIDPHTNFFGFPCARSKSKLNRQKLKPKQLQVPEVASWSAGTPESVTEVPAPKNLLSSIAWNCFGLENYKDHCLFI